MCLKDLRDEFIYDCDLILLEFLVFAEADRTTSGFLKVSHIRDILSKSVAGERWIMPVTKMTLSTD